MKKALSIAAIITVVSLAANAQEGKPKDRLAGLQLSAQQKTSVDSVRRLYDGKRATLKNDASLSQEAKAEKMKEIRKEQNTAINTILTPEQKQQLKKERKKKED